LSLLHENCEELMCRSASNVSIVSNVASGSGEVRVSGTAAPDANVTVNGTRITVRADGTWSVRVRGGSGPKVVNVVSVSADGSSRSSASVTVSG
jgi:hypothetical protein